MVHGLACTCMWLDIIFVKHAGTVQPGDMDATLCQLSAAGTCRTDMSWITSSVGINSAVLNDPVRTYSML